MTLKDFEGVRKYKVLTVLTIVSGASLCLVGPFVDYETYLRVFLYLTAASSLALILLTVASLRSYKNINTVLDRISAGRKHSLSKRPQLMHAITLPIYLEPTEVLVESLQFLAGHHRATNDYLLFLCFEARAKDSKQKAEYLKKAFEDKFRSFECVFHELKPREPPGKASNLQNCLYQMDGIFKQKGIDSNTVMFTTIDSDNWIPEAYFEEMELVLSQNNWNLHNFAFGADQMYSIDAVEVPLLSRGADFLIGCLGFFCHSSERSELISNYSVSYSTFEKIGFFDIHPDVNINDETFLRYKLLWKVQGMKVVKLPVIVNMCSSKTGKGYWADLKTRFWVAVRHLSSLQVLSYSLNVYFKNGLPESVFGLVVQSLFRIFQFLVGILPLLSHLTYRLAVNPNFTLAELLLYLFFFLLGVVNCTIYYKLVNRSAKVLYKQEQGVSRWRLVESVSTIYFLLVIFQIVALFVALIKNLLNPSVIESAPKLARNKYCDL